jgi:hypothetical protein
VWTGAILHITAALKKIGAADAEHPSDQGQNRMYCLGKSFVSYKISNIRMIRYGRFHCSDPLESIPVLLMSTLSDDPQAIPSIFPKDKTAA